MSIDIDTSVNLENIAFTIAEDCNDIKEFKKRFYKKTRRIKNITDTYIQHYCDLVVAHNENKINDSLIRARNLSNVEIYSLNRDAEFYYASCAVSGKFINSIMIIVGIIVGFVVLPIMSYSFNLLSAVAYICVLPVCILIAQQWKQSNENNALIKFNTKSCGIFPEDISYVLGERLSLKNMSRVIMLRRGIFLDKK